MASMTLSMPLIPKGSLTETSIDGDGEESSNVDEPEATFGGVLVTVGVCVLAAAGCKLDTTLSHVFTMEVHDFILTRRNVSVSSISRSIGSCNGFSSISTSFHNWGSLLHQCTHAYSPAL